MNGSYLSSPEESEKESDHNDSTGSLDLLCQAAERMSSDFFNCKRKYQKDGWPSLSTDKKFAKLNGERTILESSDRHELGIIGVLPGNEDEELLSIFPTPSPQGSYVVRSNPNAKSKIHHPEITKNKVISLFDSPDEKTGWSELGLRIRKPPIERPASGEGYFNYVADEVVLKIFEFMPKAILVKCARICKRWKRLAFDSSLWRRLDLSGRLLEAGNLGDCVLNRGAEILKLTNAEIKVPLYKNSIVESSKLRCLDLSMATISVDGVVELLSHCRDLQRLSVEHVQINEAVCRMIAKSKSLSILNMSMAEGLTYKGLSHIIRQCLLLEQLNIAWTHLTVRDVKAVASHLPNTLIRLNFSGCRENMSDAVVAMLVKSCPYLQELDISDSLKVTEEAVFSISSNLKMLFILHLSRCYYIIPEALKCLQSLPKLYKLNIFSMMQEENLHALIRFFSGMEINSQLFSTIARPTVGIYRTSIWNEPTRDMAK